MIMRRRHPALDVDETGVSLARVTASGDVQLVRSDGALLAADDVKDTLAFAPRAYADLAERWSGDDVVAFAGGDRTAPTFAEVLALVIHALDSAMEFPRVVEVTRVGAISKDLLAGQIAAGRVLIEYRDADDAPIFARVGPQP